MLRVLPEHGGAGRVLDFRLRELDRVGHEGRHLAGGVRKVDL